MIIKRAVFNPRSKGKPAIQQRLMGKDPKSQNRSYRATDLTLYLYFPAVLVSFITLITYPVNYYLHSLHLITSRQYYIRRNHIIQAKGSITTGTNKMHVVIVVVSLFACLAQGIFN